MLLEYYVQDCLLYDDEPMVMMNSVSAMKKKFQLSNEMLRLQINVIKYVICLLIVLFALKII